MRVEENVGSATQSTPAASIFDTPVLHLVKGLPTVQTLDH